MPEHVATHACPRTARQDYFDWWLKIWMTMVGDPKVKNPNAVKLDVSIKGGESTGVTVGLGDTVATLKKYIHQRTGIAPELQSLTYRGKPLINDQQLKSYGVGNNSHIDFFVEVSAG
jgi:hypothetical protein